MTTICKLCWLTLATSMMTIGGAAATEADYACSDGSKLMADFSPPGQTPGEVKLSIDGSPDLLVLPQAVSADGGRYEKEDIEFWIKGRDATLTRQGKTVICKGS